MYTILVLQSGSSDPIALFDLFGWTTFPSEVHGIVQEGSENADFQLVPDGWSVDRRL
jgi:hypothetical protein